MENLNVKIYDSYRKFIFSLLPISTKSNCFLSLLIYDLSSGLDTDSLQSDFDEVDEETIEFFIREEIEVVDPKQEE